MALFIKKRSHKAGMPPGELVAIHGAIAAEVCITSYSDKSIEEKENVVVDDKFCLPPLALNCGVHWIHVKNTADLKVVERIGNYFRLHRLVVEDIVTHGQRPKFEEYEEYAVIILRSLSYNENRRNVIEEEQVSIVIYGNTLISFQEKNTPLFDVIRERLRSARGNIRRMGADYLAYSLIDLVVDNYFLVLEKIDVSLERLDDLLTLESKSPMVQNIHDLRSDVIFLRQSVWPLREVISRILRHESEHISKTTLLYLRDVYDHTIQVIDSVELFRDMISGMLDIYRSAVSQRLNEIIKILTIVSTIFCPLTFITGIFGMNFVNMPPLQWHYGYYGVTFFMFCLALFMAGYFKHKKWI